MVRNKTGILGSRAYGTSEPMEFFQVNKKDKPNKQKKQVEKVSENNKWNNTKWDGTV